jgi:hypothetical protein
MPLLRALLRLQLVHLGYLKGLKLSLWLLVVQYRALLMLLMLVSI